MPAMNFDQALRAEPWHALALGIPGMSPGANASRLRTARRVWREYQTYSQTVYDSQIWTYDPDPQPSFCLYPLIEAGGSIQRVVDAPNFATKVLDHIGRGYREEIVSDEDGTRWERFGPGINDYRAAARETAHIRAQLQLRGLILPRPRGHAVTYGFLPPRYEPPAAPGVEPSF
ncbi:hypothetical protein [Promicromonospora iranensis]|uniref:Uncharacterized protein n=1 Tax=Promicromonospora iranensis TaxID=1105144 RepID=A0ABU2CIU5_9MICO|nr:hypothetical protein [Promicromonospora iranensis]MDR7381270.1 hypothetical protein [Promicromonospora iranensis]